MARLPSGTVTLFFSDIEGSTRLLRRLGPAYETALTDHRRLLRAAFASRHGSVVETRGDSFLVAFRSATEAVEAAVAAQRALAAHRWPEGTSLRVRMGLHMGEPSVGAGGYVGIDVHRAARIDDAAHGGQVLVSETTRALVGGGVVLRDLGEHRLAGLARPERLYQVISPGLVREFAPPRAQRPPRRRRGRAHSAQDLERVGWRVHGLLAVSPPSLCRLVEELAGMALAAARAVADADRTLATSDRDELASRVADYQLRAAVAPHIAREEARLAGQLVALDQLPERRAATAEQISRLEDDLPSPQLRLESAPRAGAAPALTEELEELQSSLATTATSLKETYKAAPPSPLPAGRFHRTRRRSIYRVEDSYVVLVKDEQGLRRPNVVGSLAQAIELARRPESGPPPRGAATRAFQLALAALSVKSGRSDFATL
jgi:class 3 adenylate cyclase